jgi:uncharacterized protein (TIGR02145 family)
MGNVQLSRLMAGAAAVLFMSGCGDSPGSTEPSVSAAPTVITGAVTQIRLHSAVVGGEVTTAGGSAVTVRGAVWSRSPDPTLANHVSSDGGGTGSFTSSLTDLESGVLYFVRAYATNREGTAYGDETSFRTSQGTITDIDGNEYEIVKIPDWWEGDTYWWWMAENLKVTRYRNGDPIPTGLSDAAWLNADYGAYRVYPVAAFPGLTSEDEVVKHYGRLYNWFTAADPRGICPEGWRVPDEGDWDRLTLAHGGDREAGENMKSVRTEPTAHPRWRWHNKATDQHGWAGLPGGRALWDGRFSGGGTHGNWLSSERDSLHNHSRFAVNSESRIIRNYAWKQNGNSIRCVKGADEN